jgi:hypothetical protein
MATAKKEDAIYVRNTRPVGVVLKLGKDIRYNLAYRGHRQDAIALPAEAANDREIARWLGEGRLEQISKEAYVRLAKRQMDQPRPDQTVGTSVNIKINPEDHRRPTIGAERDFKTNSTPTVRLAGDLLSTEEELELLEIQGGQDVNYPSKYR